MFNDSKIATSIENSNPPITGAGIHKRRKIETLFAIYVPSKYKTLANANVVIASSFNIFFPLIKI